jgi:hypothetical protein
VSDPKAEDVEENETWKDKETPRAAMRIQLKDFKREQQVGNILALASLHEAL